MDAMAAVHSPFPTEVDLSEIEMISDSPVKVGCYCDQLEYPDRQPESFEDLMCGFCLAARNHVDDMDTQVDVVALESAATTMIENSMGHSEEHGLDGGEMSPLPKKTYRRLRPLIIEPVMVDSPEPTHASMEEDGDCYSPSICPGGLATGDVCYPADDCLPFDSDDLSQSVEVSWFNITGLQTLNPFEWLGYTVLSLSTTRVSKLQPSKSRFNWWWLTMTTAIPALGPRLLSLNVNLSLRRCRPLRSGWVAALLTYKKVETRFFNLKRDHNWLAHPNEGKLSDLDFPCWC